MTVLREGKKFTSGSKITSISSMRIAVVEERGCWIVF